MFMFGGICTLTSYILDIFETQKVLINFALLSSVSVATSQRCPHKIIKTFMIVKNFSSCHRYQGHRWWTLELQISPRICDKIRNGPNGILRGLGETDSWKSRDSVPLRSPGIDSQPGGINSSESIPGIQECWEIRVLIWFLSHPKGACLTISFVRDS
jgi:hypothetical protein